VGPLLTSSTEDYTTSATTLLAVVLALNEWGVCDGTGSRSKGLPNGRKHVPVEHDMGRLCDVISLPVLCIRRGREGNSSPPTVAMTQRLKRLDVDFCTWNDTWYYQ
jgi:hypothetical protein